MAKLSGKTAVVLGAATENNMGQVIARLFASEGAKVMVSGRNKDALSGLAKEIGCEYTLCDITKHSDVSALADKTMGAVSYTHLTLPTKA